MAGRLLVSNGMQWLLTRVFRARELHRKFGLKATFGLGLKKLISPVARVGSVYLMECDLRAGLPAVEPVQGIYWSFVMKAIWNETVVAESGHTVVVEGNHYFPPASIKTEYFRKSEAHTTCPWKGEANYYDIVVNGRVNKDAAWYYPDPSDAANEIKGHVAFWRGVQVTG